MKELPILFNTEMVRAILEGRKTQTRRVITPHTSMLDWGTKATWKIFDWVSAFVDPGPSPAGNPGPYLKVYENLQDRLMHRIYPRIHPGDLLYVRETWVRFPSGALAFKADNDSSRPTIGSRVEKWKPSIHMPKKFARIWLRVTDVRVERVVDISPNDIYAEGVGCGESSGELIKMFRELWDSINAKRGYGVDTNPWVWVVEFEKERMK